MKMLRWMCGCMVIKRDKIRNDHSVQVVHIKDNNERRFTTVV